MQASHTMKADTNTARDLVQFLTFTLMGEEYGIPILQVQEIKGYSGFTSIPNAPACLRKWRRVLN